MLTFLFSCLGTTRSFSQPQHSSTSQYTDRSVSEEMRVVSGRFDRSFSLDDLKAATQNFHSENLLGEGGFGRVYKGILDDGTVVAVKRLSVSGSQGMDEFTNEVKLLSAVQHRNLVRLFGFCAEADEKILVYEYLKHKSLDLALFGLAGPQLGWSVRRTIILDTAKALVYLHEGSRFHIIHRDIKATNILLDGMFHAKIADFGLAKLFDSDQTHAMTKLAGSFGYLAPEYALNGKLTDKADVYSFGIVMLEVVSGRRHTEFHLPDSEKRLVEVAYRLFRSDRLIELVDRKMGDGYVPGEAARLIHVALLCTQEAHYLRPSMSRVVTLLNGRSQISEIPTQPHIVYTESSKQRRGRKRDDRSISATSDSSTIASIQSFFSQKGGHDL